MDDTDRDSNSSVRENDTGFSGSDAKQHAILGTLWGSVAAWRQQMLLIVTQYCLSKKMAEKINRDAAMAEFLTTLTSEWDTECISQLKMDTQTFHLLCQRMRERGLLRDTRAVSVKEVVAEFLHTLSHSVRNRSNSVRFHRSGEIISRHFKEVLFGELCDCWFNNMFVKEKQNIKTLVWNLELMSVDEHIFSMYILGL